LMRSHCEGRVLLLSTLHCDGVVILLGHKKHMRHLTIKNRLIPESFLSV